LHPKQSAEVPPLPDTAPRIVVDPEVVSDLIKRRIANGSAPSYSGWTGELLKCLVDDNNDCLQGLAALVEDQLNGTLDDISRDYILGSSLIAATKLTGIRPIAMGEVIYKLAGQYALH